MYIQINRKYEHVLVDIKFIRKLKPGAVPYIIPHSKQQSTARVTAMANSSDHQEQQLQPTRIHTGDSIEVQNNRNK